MGFSKSNDRSAMVNSSHSPAPEAPLLSVPDDDTVDTAVDYRGRPAPRSRTGSWRSAAFIIGVEVAERFAYYGICSNLINYLTGPLGQSTVAAAINVNIWSGTASLLPLLGAFLADSFIGRYRTIIVATVAYILGLGLLTFSALLISNNSFNCQIAEKDTSCFKIQIVLFFFSLYLVALAQGGHKPCVQAFGADQFDREDPKEQKARSSFFNWWYFAMGSGLLVTLAILNYIQDNLSWSLGFGIPCIVMVISLLVFYLGSRTYRFSVGEERSPFVRLGRVFIIAVRNWKINPSAIAEQEEARGILPHESSQQFKFLNKALIQPSCSKTMEEACTAREVEEAKSVLRLMPIWATSLVYAVVFAQTSTFFTKQGVTMDRRILPGFYLPSASLQSFISLSIVVFIPLYDRIFVPIAKTFTRRSSGITMLQRIGTGMFLSAVSMVVAALVEMKRLKTARDSGLVDLPNQTVPMSVWWLIPQYSLFGIADVFTMVGLQEFFYDQVPDELRSIGLALYLSIFGVGSFLSSFIISIIQKATGGGHDSWFATNLNHAHLDYFYALLAALSAVELSAFLFFSKYYVYRR